MRRGKECALVIDEAIDKAARRHVARSACSPSKEEISFSSTMVTMKEEEKRSAARDGE